MKASKERKVIKQYSVAVECYPYIAYPQPSENEIVAKENIDESNSQQIVERPIVMAKRITRATSTKSKNIPSTALKSERVTRATSTKSKNIESTLLQTGNIVETSLKRKADSSEMKASKKRKVTKQYSVSLECDPSTSQKSNEKVETVAEIDFKIGEIVWAKIKGFPHWPAEIVTFHSNKMLEVVWFNDYRKTKLYKTQLFKFLTNFETFSTNFDNAVGLQTAAKEAMISYMSKQPCKRMF